MILELRYSFERMPSEGPHDYLQGLGFRVQGFLFTPALARGMIHTGHKKGWQCYARKKSGPETL